MKISPFIQALSARLEADAKEELVETLVELHKYFQWSREERQVLAGHLLTLVLKVTALALDTAVEAVDAAKEKR